MNILRCTAIITHHTAGLDKLGSLNSEGSGALLRWAAPEQRCCTGTPSKIHPSTHAMKLTAWARLVAPATRAGRSTTSCSCTRWSAPLCCAAETEARLVTLERDAIRPATGRVHAHVSRGCTQHGAGVSRRRARVIPAFPRSARLTSAPRSPRRR